MASCEHDVTALYFLAGSLSGLDGGSRAGADILQHLMTPDKPITVIAADRCPLESEFEGEQLPEPRWLLRPAPSGSEWLQGRSPVHMARRLRHAGLRHAIGREVRKRPPSLAIHNGFPVPGSVNTEILSCAEKQLIVVHSSPESLDFFTRGRRGWDREWVAERLRAADALMFVSPQLQQSWSEVAAVERIPSYVVPNTTREGDVREAMARTQTEIRRLLGLPLGALLACCVGKVDVSKGQDVLIEALPGMLSAAPNLHLVLVGPITPYGEHLPGLVKHMGLQANVSFLGSRSDAVMVMRACDLLIQPSRAEGLSLVMLEAMALGMPIVATSVGGAGFALDGGTAGLLVEPGKAHDLIEAFRLLAGDTGLRSALGFEASRRYWAMFSRVQHRERVQAMLNSCLKKATASANGCPSK